jgi:hypothetical protein
MPDPITHIHFLKQTFKENKQLFSKLNKTILFNGAVAPDLYYYLPIKNYEYFEKNLSNYWHGYYNDNKIGLKFAKDLIKYSKNKKELAFGIGFLSHFILDMQIHNYLRKIKQLQNINHLVIEHFLDSKFKGYMPLIKFPKKLMRKILKKEHPKFYHQYMNQLNFTIFTPYLYKIYNFINHFIITRKYKSRWNTKKLMIWDPILWLAYYKPVKRIGFKNLNKLVYPDYNLKEKYISKIEIEIKKARKKFIKEIKMI